MYALRVRQIREQVDDLVEASYHEMALEFRGERRGDGDGMMITKRRCTFTVS